MNISPTDIQYLITLIKNMSGVCLTTEKDYLLESRLLPVIRMHGIKDFAELVTILKTRNDHEIYHEVIDAITTNETSFFRDLKSFDVFKNEIIPVMAQMPTNKLRIWSSACSSGQEAYSIAITMYENVKRVPKAIEIFGSDINRIVVEHARSGTYSQFEVQRGMPIMSLINYFEQIDELWRVKKDIMKMTKFDVVNLVEDFTGLVGKFDVIFCRNVLIYFDKETKKKVLENIAKVLQPHGVLIVASSETPMESTNKFVHFKKGLPSVYKLSGK